MSPDHPFPNTTSMTEVLQARAAATPDIVGFSFLADGEEEGPRLSYADLDRRSRAVAVALLDIAGRGDRALLLYAPGLDFIPAFFGCLYAGVVPVPAYPPRLDRLAQSWHALSNVANDCRPTVVLTQRSLAASFGGAAAVPQLAALPWLCTDALDPSGAAGWRERAADPDALALLQYTSGSTADPKGVRVTHRNLLHNQRVMQAADGPGSEPGVCWLPVYHDMGLLGAVVQGVFRGAPCVMMSPLGILQKPFRWLRAVSRYRARISGGPNFVYELCAERVTAEQKADLDLSGWAVAVVGGEPINPRTLERFAAAFAPCGFRAEAFSPCYGLAEATLLVTGRRPSPPKVQTVGAAALEEGRIVDAERAAHGARTFVSCGTPWLDQQVVLAHPETMTRCPPGAVGEIWVSGPSVADGYWGRPEETERTFRAYLRDTGPVLGQGDKGTRGQGESASRFLKHQGDEPFSPCPLVPLSPCPSTGPFLRTGDLGFVADGELYVTGRLKDLLIINGRNHYPQDIEATVQASHPGLRAGGGAAFETPRDGTPRLVVVQEVERRARHLDAGRLLGDVRQAVAERHGVHVHDLLLLEHGSLPKTSSGKVQRHRCRLGYEQGTLRPWKGTRGQGDKGTRGE